MKLAEWSQGVSLCCCAFAERCLWHGRGCGMAVFFLRDAVAVAVLVRWSPVRSSVRVCLPASQLKR